jgi:hypothetical protein
MKRNKLADRHVNEKTFVCFTFRKRNVRKNKRERVGEMMMNGSIIGGADKSKKHVLKFGNNRCKLMLENWELLKY